jgi:D-apionolactonase
MSPIGETLHALIGANSFGPFHHQGREILRRLFVTLRDEAWQETPPTSWIATVDESARMIRVEARHTTEQLDVGWHGTLTVGDDARSGNFELEAVAHRPLRVCRLGLVVLHPVDFMVGASILARAPQDSISLTVSRRIARQPIVEGLPGGMTPGFSTLEIEHEGIGHLALEFGGDLFELEDQRNWGDHSFKTYCTPLRLGFPRTIDAGNRITQRLRWRFTPVSRPTVARECSERVSISSVMPSIGWSGPSQSPPLRSRDHWALDLRASDRCVGLPDRLDIDPDQGLEISVADNLSTASFKRVSAWIAARPAGIVRLLIYGSDRALPEPGTIAQWRDVLAKMNLSHVPLLAATRGYFVEFNRTHMPTESWVDGFAFPHTPTVHADDTATVIDNVATIRDMADTARSLTRQRILALAPLALYYPGVRRTRALPPGLTVPWLAANLIQAAAAGINAITLDEELAQALSVANFAALLPGRGTPITIYVDEARPTLHMAHVVHGGAERWLAVNLGSRTETLHEPAFARRQDLSVAPRSVRWFE